MNRKELKKKFPKAYAVLENDGGNIPGEFELDSKGRPTFIIDGNEFESDAVYTWTGTCWFEFMQDDDDEV